jgi:hypothetical protein
MLSTGTCKSQNYFLVQVATTAKLIRALESGMFDITLCVVRSVNLINVAVYVKFMMMMMITTIIILP